jgi:hypothetical protein
LEKEELLGVHADTVISVGSSIPIFRNATIHVDLALFILAKALVSGGMETDSCVVVLHFSNNILSIYSSG